MNECRTCGAGTGWRIHGHASWCDRVRSTVLVAAAHTGPPSTSGGGFHDDRATRTSRGYGGPAWARQTSPKDPRPVDPAA